MACRISELVVKCRDPRRLAEFWCEVLGFTVLVTDYGAVAALPPEGFGGTRPTLVFMPTAEPSASSLRFDVTATDPEAELGRLLKLGARPAHIGDESWHVLEDPEGNEFRLRRARRS